MMKSKRNGISPTLAIVIVAAIVLLGAFALSGFMLGLLGTYAQGIGASVDPRIYAPQQAIGVLNQNATFIVTVSNSQSNAVSGTVELSAGGTVVRNQSFSLASGQASTFNLSTPLFTTGEWTITVATPTITLHPYSFVVEQNTDAADSQLTANSNAQEQTLLLIVGPVAAALIGIVPGAYSLYLRRQDRHARVMVQRFKEGAYWFIRVNCMKDFVEKCVVTYGDQKLALKEPPTQTRFEVSLRPGGGENFRFNVPTPPSDNDSTSITVLDDRTTLFKRQFKDITMGEVVSGPTPAEKARVEEEARKSHWSSLRERCIMPTVAGIDYLLNQFRSSDMVQVSINKGDEVMPKWNLSLFTTPVTIGTLYQTPGLAGGVIAQFDEVLFQDLANHYPQLKGKIDNAQMIVKAKGSRTMQLRWGLGMQVFRITKPKIDTMKFDGSIYPMGTSLATGILALTDTPPEMWPSIHEAAERTGILSVVEALRADSAVMDLAREYESNRKAVETELVTLRNELGKALEWEKRLPGNCEYLP